jgi:hypothetical protein
MEVELLAHDLDELAADGTEPGEALARGARALGERRLAVRPDDPGLAAEELRDTIDTYAEAEADLRLVRFDYARRAPAYHEARLRHHELAKTVRAARTKRGPALAADLLQLRAREQTLERELLAAGVDPEAVAPSLPANRASDLSYALLHVPGAGRPLPQAPRRRRFRRGR